MTINEFIHGLINFIADPIHLLTILTNNYAQYVYAIVFLLLLLESCWMFFSWIPGQSMIFILGTLSTQSDNILNPVVLGIGFFIMAQAGNVVKYHHGYHLGAFKNKHLTSSTAFVKDHERLSLLLSNFIPVIGLLVPIIGGREKLEFRRFFKLTMIGELLWVSVIILLGYFLGHFAWVTKNYAVIVIFMALLPLIVATLFKYAKEIFLVLTRSERE